MCEQTEINYLDGDIVWVKLGSYWWPGQVVGLDKLPDDIQAEFKKKPIIAAVKFFQENSFEFVKTYHQIYKYNCTQKEEFIRKGLDKYRAKSKDGSNYMDKFPEDVKTAEILTNGDPYILLNKKFNPKEKPDISGLFGEKKIIKKKRSRDDYVKKVDDEIRPRITHPRFLQENDHEVRIRKQPKMLPLSSNNYSSVGIYPCHVCGFTATRVNIIICHLKNHRINKEVKVTMNSKIKTGIPLKQKQTNLDSPKRKYIRKLVSSKVKNNSAIETGKRKYCKQIEKPIKKKKSDPELREKLLADWNVDTDEDEPLYFEKSLNDCTVDLSNKKLSCLENSDMVKLESGKYNNDSLLILQASNKLLIETDSTTDFSIIEKDKSNSKMNVKQNMDENQEKCTNIVIENSFLLDDKKSKLSCFDFDEDDVLEESISTVRKIPRSLGSKNMSIKKEIIKEFQMSQALKMDKDLIKNNENKLNIQINKDLIMVKDKVQITEDIEDNKILKNEENTNKCQNWDKNREEVLRSEELCETHLEIVEIFEVEKENVDLDKREEQKESINLKNDHISEFNIQEYIKLRTNETIDNINTEKDILLETQDKKNEFKSINTNKSKEIKRNECKELVQLEQDSSNLLSVKSNISNKTSIIETKNDFPSSGNMNQFCETKLKTNSPVDYVNDEQNNSDTEVSPILECALQGLLIDKQKNNPINDNLNIVDKKQRGRPKKKKSIIEDILSDNDDQKVNTLKKKFEHLKKLSDLDLNQSNSIQKQNSDSYSNLHTLKSNYREIKVNENFLGNDIDIKQKMVNKKLEGNEVNSKIINKIQNSNSSLKNTYTTNIEGSIKEDIFEIEKSIEEKSDTSIAVATLHDDKGDLVVQSEHSNENSEYDDFADNYDNLKDKKKKKKI